MYHDQGLIPFKTLSFGQGLISPLVYRVRTSPDHGTAFDIAGQGVAQTDSFRLLYSQPNQSLLSEPLKSQMAVQLKIKKRS